MRIVRAKYLENGYFEVVYRDGNNFSVIQDTNAIKMQVPMDEHTKDFLLFMRRIKLEKIEQGDNFDELKYRNSEVFSTDDGMKGMKAYAAAHVAPPLPKSKFGNDDLDELLGAL